MLRLAPRNQRQCATENTEYLASNVLIFFNLCCLYIFYDSIKLKCVSIDTYDSQKTFVDMSLVLSKLKVIYTHRRWIIHITPNALCSYFTDFFLFFHSILCYDLFALLPYFFMLCLSSRNKPYNSGVIFYLKYLPSPPTFHRNGLCRPYVNSIWLYLKHYSMRTVVFVR